jgi:hypothetical protein
MLSGLLSATGAGAAAVAEAEVAQAGQDAAALRSSDQKRVPAAAAQSHVGAPDIADLPPEDLFEAKRCMEMALGLWREPVQVRTRARAFDDVRDASPIFLFNYSSLSRLVTPGCCTLEPLRQ